MRSTSYEVATSNSIGQNPMNNTNHLIQPWKGDIIFWSWFLTWQNAYLASTTIRKHDHTNISTIHAHKFNRFSQISTAKNTCNRNDFGAICVNENWNNRTQIPKICTGIMQNYSCTKSDFGAICVKKNWNFFTAKLSISNTQKFLLSEARQQSRFEARLEYPRKFRNFLRRNFNFLAKRSSLDFFVTFCVKTKSKNRKISYWFPILFSKKSIFFNEFWIMILMNYPWTIHGVS